MIRKLFLISFVISISTVSMMSQSIVRSEDLFKRSEGSEHTGHLNIQQDPALDTLLSRYILGFKNQEEKIGYSGMDGWRIQIYSSSNRNAKEESSKTDAEFLIKFPGIKSYTLFAPPAYYKIRVGDFRTKTEATRLFLLISKAFPDAYLVPDIINFPEPNTK
jgi:hypothetical protein